jgi:hypothetical protein
MYFFHRAIGKELERIPEVKTIGEDEWDTVDNEEDDAAPAPNPDRATSPSSGEISPPLIDDMTEESLPDGPELIPFRITTRPDHETKDHCRQPSPRALKARLRYPNDLFLRQSKELYQVPVKDDIELEVPYQFAMTIDSVTFPVCFPSVVRITVLFFSVPLRCCFLD